MSTPRRSRSDRGAASFTRPKRTGNDPDIDPIYIDQAQDDRVDREPPEELLTAERLATINCPTLVLWTRQNPTMPWHVGEEASRIIPNAQWYLMEDAGHWPQFEKPAEFNELVRAFLRRVGEDRAAVSATGTG